MMTATAAAADPGPRDDVGQPDAVQEQEQIREQVREHDADCQTDECEPVRQQTRSQEQVREHDADCQTDECELIRQQTRDQEKVREHDVACRADDAPGDCEPVREREREIERFWERLTESTDWGTEYRSVARWMWRLFSRPFAALSFME
jgi:hypothetical protein